MRVTQLVEGQLAGELCLATVSRLTGVGIVRLPGLADDVQGGSCCRWSGWSSAGPVVQMGWFPSKPPAPADVRTWVSQSPRSEHVSFDEKTSSNQGAVK